MTRRADINDILRAEGEDSVRKRLDGAKRYKKGANGKGRFALTAFDDVTAGSEGVYLIKNIIPRHGLIVIWGPRKSGKSFWTFDASMHIALGWKYRGRRTRQGIVVYLALEGAKGFERRIEAFRQRHLVGHTERVPFYLCAATLDLVKDHAELIKCIREKLGKDVPVLVVIDTLNRSLVGSESNDQDMGNYIKAASAIESAFGCAVAIVHHSGVDGTRPRGHTSLSAAADAQLSVKRDATKNVLVEVEFQKDGPEGEIIASRLEQVILGHDDDGEVLDTCIVLPVDEAVVQAIAVKPAKPVKMPKAAQIALRALNETISECGEPAPPSNYVPRAIYVTTFERWRDYAYRRGISTGEDRARQKAFKQASEYLIAGEHVMAWEGYVWTKTVTPRLLPESESDRPADGERAN